MEKSVSYKVLILSTVVAVLSHLVKSQTNCSVLTSCADCIVSAGCSWCYDPSYPSTSSRCSAATDSVFLSSCSDSLENPTNNVNAAELVLNNINQVSLESINLQLKVGTPESFNLLVKAAEEFPLDLYLLMDFSGSFRDDLVVMQSISPQLVQSLSNVTTQFRVGFGAFVDKPVPPYSSLTQIACSYQCQSSQSPFSFQHIVNFTSNSEVFTEAIRNGIISATADDPEGTLDAMLQAVVCTDVIGWRADARKVLLVITDDLMHMAGDGALAGINRPNDAVCRTSFDPSTGKTMYTAALEYDYPSIEQVRSALIEHEIFPVLALGTAEVISLEKNVVINAIVNALDAIPVELEKDSSNLVEAINNAYNQIVNQAGLTFNAPSFLSVSVTPTCPEGSTMNGTTCVGIANNTVTFTMTVTLNECVDEVMNDDAPFTMQVNVRGFDTFTVHVRGYCSCECRQPDRIEVNSTMCNANGNLVCGVCECVEPYDGRMCDCDLSQKCPSVGEVECTGASRGTCNRCGECECNEEFFGPACECSNFGCDCSGRGECTSCANGTKSCECYSSYFGENCQCTYDVCIDQKNTSAGPCYGNGECNPCLPQPGCTCNATHLGMFCSVIVETVSECSANQTCVECFSLAALQGLNVNEVSGCETASTYCATYSAISSNEVNEEYLSSKFLGSTDECQVLTVQCVYMYHEGISPVTGQTIYAVEPAICLAIPFWAIPAIIVMGSLIVIGLTVVIAACLIIRWLDYREVKRFEKTIQEAQHLAAGVNPRYVSPSVTYHNPLLDED